MMNQLARRYLPQCIGIAILIFAFNPDNPYGYYIFLRFSIFLIALYLIASQAIKLEIEYFMYVLVGAAIIYNPFITFHLGRDIWSVVNICTIFLFIYSMWLWRKQTENDKEQVEYGLVDSHEIDIPSGRPDTSYSEFNSEIKSLSDYESAVNHYISWTNHLEALYVIRAVDEDFERLEKEVVMNSYRSNASHKVTGLLIVDAIRVFNTSHSNGVEFLRNLNDSLLDDLGDNLESQLDDDSSKTFETKSIEDDDTGKICEQCGMIFIPHLSSEEIEKIHALRKELLEYVNDSTSKLDPDSVLYAAMLIGNYELFHTRPKY